MYDILGPNYVHIIHKLTQMTVFIMYVTHTGPLMMRAIIMFISAMYSRRSV